MTVRNECMNQRCLSINVFEAIILRSQNFDNELALCAAMKMVYGCLKDNRDSHA